MLERSCMVASDLEFVPSMDRRVLIVDGAPTALLRLAAMVDGTASVAVADRFSYASTYLTDAAVDLLITNARLDQHSGMDLVRLAAGMRLPMRSVVYTAGDDFECVRETQNLRAFYERADRLLFALPAYVHAALPDRDRRDAWRPDRRAIFRGGRRASDIQAVAWSIDLDHKGGVVRD
jgi:DNA-binding NtrC family response regulator